MFRKIRKFMPSGKSQPSPQQVRAALQAEMSAAYAAWRDAARWGGEEAHRTYARLWNAEQALNAHDRAGRAA